MLCGQSAEKEAEERPVIGHVVKKNAPNQGVRLAIAQKKRPKSGR